ncbi:actin nucleation-promoting factor WAS-like [Physeter macrocephalus]|uniref:Actin nucleation-promoting factor WAS-like n=1 Tax=Physeter macrocephalus TaxID=9755 RepID=A0A455BG11_PHYMC|nr:actin nucleation-promoting factor WAS-like [Physeter catodon]|eukprot:XP_028342886.1 wiskott-Aldrich syndrome protein-like [Physeter catodon]
MAPAPRSPPELSLRAGQRQADTGRPPACARRLSGRGGTPGPFRGWARAPPRSGGRSAVSTPVSPPGPAGRRPSPGGRTGNSQPAGVGRRIPGPDRDGPSRAGGGTMFSLKPPRPTFRSYLLPPPQTDDNINSEPKIKKLEPVLLPARGSRVASKDDNPPPDCQREHRFASGCFRIGTEERDPFL